MNNNTAPYTLIQAAYARTPGLRHRFPTLSQALACEPVAHALRLDAEAIARRGASRGPHPQLELLDDYLGGTDR